VKLVSSAQPERAAEPAAAAFRGGLLQRQGLEVSQPGDALETEASSAARRVVQMPATASAAPGVAGLPTAASASARIQRQAHAGSAAGLADAASARLPSRLAGQRGQGQALPPRLRRDMEGRFGARFDGVRVHTGGEAATLSRGLQARAFTTGGDVFFGDGQFQPDSASGRELLAHELAHTVQQGAAPVVEAAAAAGSTTTGTARTPRIQRSVAAGLSRAPGDSLTRVMRVALPGAVLNTLAGWAANLPGFTLLTVVLGRNPINGAAVDRSIVNLLRGFIGLIPGGEALWQVLQRYGGIATLGGWAQQAVGALGLSFDMVRGAFTRFVDTLGVLDVFDPGGVWDRARAIFGPIVARITAFVERLITQAVAAVKAALMPPLSDFCRQVPGYGLVTVMLGRDPFTDAPVARTPLAIVRAFAEFIPGGSEKVDQLVQSGALDRAYRWFVAETTSRNLTWTRVTGTFAAAWATLQLSDVLQPIATLQRIVGMFRPLMSDLIGFAGAALMKLLELIYEAAMGAGGRRILDILTRARGTFNVIIRDPVGFLRNLLGAVGQGVRQFMSNILTHLRDGVIAWLTGPVAAAGIQMPERWDLRGIIGFVLQILGLSWARVREKLVRLLGDRVVAGLEAGFQLLLDIRDRGLVAALRERVTEFFGSLREAALGAIRSFIQQRLVMAGITQLLSMLNPVGAIIQAIIKTYTTIQFFIQRINQILDLVESVVNSIGAIASGAIGAAAGFVERTMARTIPVVLDFLARFIGLGDVGAQVQRTIRNLQASVDRMLDRAVEWIRTQARSLMSRALGGNASATPQQRLSNGLREGVAAVNRLTGTRIGQALIRPVLAVVRARHAMQSLEAVAVNGLWRVRGRVNPEGDEATMKQAEAGATAAPVPVSTPIVHKLRSGRMVATRVTAIDVTMTVGGVSLIGARLEWDNAWVPYSGFGPTWSGTTTWTAPPVPPHVPFMPNPARVVIDRANVRSGTSASGNPPGWDSAGTWPYRGHLVGRALGGPGGAGSGNIVAMTHRANALGSGMPGIEGPVLRDIEAGAVYDYRVYTDFDPALQVPPTQIRVVANRLYPDAQKPLNVPSQNPYIVINTPP